MSVEHSAVIHQPHFFPWPPYVARVALCDVLVIQDSVQFRKAYFHNRTRFLNRSGHPFWLTVPVHASSTTTINEVLVDVSHRRIVLKYRNVLKDAYQHTPSFPQIWPRLDEFLCNIGKTQQLTSLHTLNTSSITFLLALLDITAPRIVYASDLGVDGGTRTARLVEILKAVGCTRYLTGWGGSRLPHVHDLVAFSSSGIEVLGMDRTEVDARVPAFTTVEGLSTLHWALTWGLDATKDRLIALADTFASLSPSGKVETP